MTNKNIKSRLENDEYKEQVKKRIKELEKYERISTAELFDIKNQSKNQVTKDTCKLIINNRYYKNIKRHE